MSRFWSAFSFSNLALFLQKSFISGFRFLLVGSYASIVSSVERSQQSWEQLVVQKKQDYPEYFFELRSAKSSDGTGGLHAFDRRYIFELRNPVFDPVRGVVETRGVGIRESVPWSPEKRFQRRPRFTPARRETSNGAVVAIGQVRWNYYHFLIEDLPMAIRAQETSQQVKVVVSSDAPAYVTSFLDLARLPWAYVSRRKMFRRLILPTRGNDTGWPHRQDLHLLARLANRVPSDAPQPSLVYVSRRKSNRSFVNEDRLELEISRIGFQVVYLEEESPERQIALFGSARVVVGAHGAGLSNIVFCSPGTTVIEITSERWDNRCFEVIAQETNLHYLNVPAQSDSLKNGNSVEVERVLRVVRTHL